MINLIPVKLLHYIGMTNLSNEEVKKYYNIPDSLPDKMPEASMEKHEKLKVMVIDDSAASRRIIRRVLISMDYDVQSESNGEEALSHINEYSPDVLILDVEMPVINGHDVALKIRSEHALAEMPVVVLAKSRNVNELFSDIANCHIVENETPESIIDVVNSVKSSH